MEDHGRKTSDNPKEKVPPAAEKPEKAIVHYYFFKGDTDAIDLIKEHCEFIIKEHLELTERIERNSGRFGNIHRKKLIAESLVYLRDFIMAEFDKQVTALKALPEKKDAALPVSILKTEAGFFKAVEIAEAQFDYCPFKSIERTGTYNDLYQLRQSMEAWLEKYKKCSPKAKTNILFSLNLNLIITCVCILVDSIITKLR